MGGLTDAAADRAPDSAPDSSGPQQTARLIRPDRADGAPVRRTARPAGRRRADAYGRKVMLIVIRVSTGTPCSNVGS